MRTSGEAKEAVVGCDMSFAAEGGVEKGLLSDHYWTLSEKFLDCPMDSRSSDVSRDA